MVAQTDRNFSLNRHRQFSAFSTKIRPIDPNGPFTADILRTENVSTNPIPPTLGDLVTNAKKVTVSVLYWYGKHSGLRPKFLEIFRKEYFFLFIFVELIIGVAKTWAGKNFWEYDTQGSRVITDLSTN